MAEFPSSPVPSYSLSLKQRWNTVVADFDGSNEQRRQKSVFPKYDVSLHFENLTEAEIATLWAFYTARGGNFESFYFYTIPNTEVWTGQYIGVGNGSETIFDIPGKSTSDQTIYVAGVPQMLTTDYSILTGGGQASSDRVEFVSAPAAGSVIKCDFTGYLRILCRFKEAEMSRELFEYLLYKASLELRGLFVE